MVELGQRIGTWNTIGIVIVTGIIGAILAKHQGFSVLRKIRIDLLQGILPADKLFEGALVLMVGLLLITPGLITDATGFLLLIPPLGLG